jgi:hypothetical protein
MFDNESGRVYDEADFTRHRVQVGRCDLNVFVSRHEPHVFVGGGEAGYGSVVGPADAFEAAALAERFGLPDPAEVARRMR